MLASFSEGGDGGGVVYATAPASVAWQVGIIAVAPADALKTPVLEPVGLAEDEEASETEAAAAEAFLAYLQSDEAADVFREYGFAICSGDEGTSAGEDGTETASETETAKTGAETVSETGDAK